MEWCVCLSERASVALYVWKHMGVTEERMEERGRQVAGAMLVSVFHCVEAL